MNLQALLEEAAKTSYGFLRNVRRGTYLPSVNMSGEVSLTLDIDGTRLTCVGVRLFRITGVYSFGQYSFHRLSLGCRHVIIPEPLTPGNLLTLLFTKPTIRILLEDTQVITFAAHEGTARHWDPAIIPKTTSLASRAGLTVRGKWLEAPHNADPDTSLTYAPS